MPSPFTSFPIPTILAPTVPTGANPTATAGPAAINGGASTYMRSDSAPAIQLGSASQKGIVQVDGSTITASAGVITAVGGGTGVPIETGTITFKVNASTGSDSNDGIINPFKTIGRATLEVSKYNFVSLGVPNIAVDPGTYNENVFLPPINAYGIENFDYFACPYMFGTGARTATIIRPPNDFPTISLIGGGAPWFVTTMTLEPSQIGFPLAACYAEGSMLLIDDLNIRPNQINNATYGWSIFCVNHGLISHEVNGIGSSVSVGAQHFVEIETGTYWQLNTPITFSGTPNYYTAVLRGWQAHFDLDNGTFIGSCTGPKIFLRFSEIQGFSTASLPGNSSGTRDIGSFIASDSVNVQTASYTLSLDDLDGVVEMNVAGANNLTVPPNASVAFPVDARRRIRIVQAGAGATTIVAGAGVTVHNAAALSAQWKACDLYQRATNEWVATFF